MAVRLITSALFNVTKRRQPQLRPLPRLEYDRSPCGTGTSAKLACLHADGKLKPGETWRQESLIGSIFEGQVRQDGDRLIPIIRGTASVTAELELVLDENDPYRFGITG